MMRLKLVYALLLAGLLLAQTAAVILGAGAVQAASKDTDAETVRQSTDEGEDVAPGIVQLNPIVEVDNDFIRVGDIFTNAGKASAKVALRAPKPGKETTLTAVWLWKLARAYRLDWRPTSKHDFAMASRKSRTIDTDTISRAIGDSMFDQTGDDDLIELILDDPRASLHLPMNVEPTIRVDRFRYDSASGRFSGVVIAPAEGRALEKLIVAGRVHRMAEVAVPVGRLSKGHVIRNRDLEIIRFRADKLGQNVVSDPSMVVGMAVKRSLRAGKPIRSSDVHPPILVKKGDRVTVVYRTAKMVLTTQGRAMQNGAAGETIPVQNTQSLAILDAEVVGSNKVSVHIGDRLALN